MKRNKWLLPSLSALAIAGLIALRVSGMADSDSIQYPNKPIQIVVPYTAGGGSDTFVRIFQKSIASQGLLSQPLVILNQPGGGGTIGTRNVKNARPDGYRILCHHEAIITSQFSGTVPFGPKDFVPIAQTGSTAFLVIVREDSRFGDLDTLIGESIARPNRVRFGADIGSLAHFIGMEVEALRPGSALNYITSGGGQKRFTMLLGGHLDAAIFTLSEYLAFRSANDTPPEQNIKAIALMESERHAAVPGVPTAVEQGFPVVSSNAFYWWAPKGTGEEVVRALADVFEKTMQDPAALAELDRLSINPTFRRDEALRRHLDGRIASLSERAVSYPTDLPNFPLWALGIAGALGVGIVIRGLLAKGDAAERSIQFGGRTRSLAALVAALVGYIVALQLEVSYLVATALAIVLLGGVVSDWKRSRMIAIVQIALLFALGSEFVFTRIFTVPLP